MSKILAILIYLSYVVYSFITGSVKDVFYISVGLLLPLICVLFPEAAGDYTGKLNLYKPSSLTSQSPAFLVKILGWLLLFLPAGIYLMLKMMEF